jgi:outer membrane protein OmpA-like peptidoglycan-associated protein
MGHLNEKRLCCKTALAALISATLLTAGCTTGPSKSIGIAADDGFQRSMYGSVGLGVSHLEPNTGDNPQFDVNDRVGGAGHVSVGADWNKNFSFEAHATDLGSAGLSSAGAADGSAQAGRLSYQMFGASVLGYIGGNRSNDGRRGLNAYGRLGLVTVNDAQIGNTLDRIDSNPLLIGAGVEYAMRSGLGFRAEVMANDTDVVYGQLGVTYRIAAGGKSRTIFAAKPVVQPPLAPPPTLAAAKSPADGDLDGIYDEFDRCPESQIYDIVNDAGCQAFAQRIEVVSFGWDSAELDRDAQLALNHIAREMKAHPGANLGLAAHTDSTGTNAYNQSLSLRRAVAVADYLHAQGVDKDAMAISLEADKVPTSNNAHARGRSENRRVELFANELPETTPWRWRAAR